MRLHRLIIIVIILLGCHLPSKSQHYAKNIHIPNLPIKTLDISADKSIFNIVEYGTARTQLHTTAVRLSTSGENLLLAYLKNNSNNIVLRYSKDGGQSWNYKLKDSLLIGNSASHISMFTLTGKTLLPKEYKKERRLANIANRNNLILFFGGYPIKAALSLNNGLQWHKTFNRIEPSDMNVTSMIRLNDSRYMALINSGSNSLNGRHVIYKSYSTDGGLSWSHPEIAIKHNIFSIENAHVERISYKGKKILMIIANDLEHKTGVISISEDEGDNWSYPTELPSFIQGDNYNISTFDKKIFIVYRDTYGSGDKNINNPTCGDLMLWYGTYYDLKHGGKNTYRVRLADLPDIDKQNHYKKNNQIYLETPTINLLSDKKISIIAYGQWQENFPPSIRSFTIFVNRLNKLQTKYELHKK